MIYIDLSYYPAYQACHSPQLGSLIRRTHCASTVPDSTNRWEAEAGHVVTFGFCCLDVDLTGQTQNDQHEEFCTHSLGSLWFTSDKLSI